MITIGITGGTGAGKTTMLYALEERGALIIDCDAVYHDLLASSADMLSEIDDRFPGVIVEGVLDRKALGRQVFGDDAALMDLNAITHKYVRGAVDDMISDWAKKGGRLVGIDAIALIESGIGDKCDVLIAVTAPEEARIERIMAREGIGREYAAMRVRAQKPDTFFSENCDIVVVNDSAGPDEFKIKCDKIIDEILEEKQ